MMSERYLEVTYRRGRALAAYLYLPRRPGDKCAKTTPAGDGLLVDWSTDGRPLGIEILHPARLDAAQLNRVLTDLAQAPLAAEELRPLAAA